MQSLNLCPDWNLARQVLLIVNQITVCILLTLRIYALYGRKKRIISSMLGFGTVLIGVSVWAASHAGGVPQRGEPGCNIADPRNRHHDRHSMGGGLRLRRLNFLYVVPQVASHAEKKRAAMVTDPVTEPAHQRRVHLLHIDGNREPGKHPNILHRPAPSRQFPIHLCEQHVRHHDVAADAQPACRREHRHLLYHRPIHDHGNSYARHAMDARPRAQRQRRGYVRRTTPEKHANSR
ncbi:hypothetical protein B0H13DRAFT_1061911 [Mycena leptocephala]|nr:hypothetical protein B0H13DRAFT_1061911 [Mycena leptocephala]